MTNPTNIGQDGLDILGRAMAQRHRANAQARELRQALQADAGQRSLTHQFADELLDFDWERWSYEADLYACFQDWCRITGVQHPPPLLDLRFVLFENVALRATSASGVILYIGVGFKHAPFLGSVA